MPSRLTDADREYRAFEKAWRGSQSSKISSRSHEPEQKFLTEKLLRDRKALTKNGRQALVLQVGKGEKPFTLAELNDMARRLAATDEKYGSGTKGVLVGDILQNALRIDKERSHKQIKTGTLYKVQANTLFFRVKASGMTAGAPSHYSVRVRLDDWGSAVRQGEGPNFYPAAQKACNGHISFDCSCGRHQFWYRYIATIGGFCLTPEEHVYPKIRNPKLKGVCCKHVLKVIAMLRTPVIQTQVSKDMERQAEKTNFETGRGKYLKATEAEEFEKASKNTSARKAYKEFKKAQAAFGDKQKEAATQKAIKELKEKGDAAMRELLLKNQALEAVTKKEIEKGRKLESDARKAYVAALQTIADFGTINDQSISKLAGRSNVDASVLTQIAKEEGLL